MTLDTAHSTSHQNDNLPLPEQLHYVEALTQDLKYVLCNCEDTLQHEGIHKNLQILEQWMESYRQGLFAANRISESGAALLNETKERLKLAADELQRLESEGGNAAGTKQQQEKAEELINNNSNIRTVITNLEQLLTSLDHPE